MNFHSWHQVSTPVHWKFGRIKQHQSMWFPLFNFHHTTHHLRHLQHHQTIGNIKRSIDMTQQQSAKLDDTQQLLLSLLYHLVIGSPKFCTSLSAEELWITLRRFEPSLVALDARIVVNWNTALETVVWVISFQLPFELTSRDPTKPHPWRFSSIDDWNWLLSFLFVSKRINQPCRIRSLDSQHSSAVGKTRITQD